MKKLYIKTYGCQMNVYDSKRMEDILSPLGYTTTDAPEEADLAILNTCHIREKAEQKVYSDLGRLKAKKNDRKEQGQDMVIAVGGCVGQAEGAEIIKNAPFVSMVFGPQTYHQLPEMIAQLHRKQDKEKGSGRGIVLTDFPVESKFDSLPSQEKSDICAFLAIQEGCDKFCHFCVVPYTRGAEFSRPAMEIVIEAKRLVSLGAREITLLGQNVNAYHGDGPHKTTWSLARLVQELAEIDGLERIRYTTSHPKDMSDDLIHAHGTIQKLMPFLHLPVQSGSDKILAAMNRKHDGKFYLDIIDKLRASRTDIAFSSDFIVGYPGETDQDHKDTLALVEAVNYGQCYSFKYSPRPGTPAAVHELQVPESVKDARLAELQGVLMAQQLRFNQSKVGTVQTVLFDRKGKVPGQLIGKTPYMQSVPLTAPDRLIGKFVDVTIKNGYAGSLQGEVVAIESIPVSVDDAA
jgi:tRNA-2-methylthio-N6-dimethylallyladenosine synthase